MGQEKLACPVLLFPDSKPGHETEAATILEP